MKRTQQTIDTETGEILSQRQLPGNSNFVQLYRTEMVHVRSLIEINKQAAQLFLFMAEKMDYTNALVVSRETLAEIFDSNVRSVSRWIKILADNKYIMIQKSGNSNVYTVNSSIAWSSNATNKQFAGFTATVLISRNEQEFNLKSSKPKQLSLLFKDKVHGKNQQALPNSNET